MSLLDLGLLYLLAGLACAVAIYRAAPEAGAVGSAPGSGRLRALGAAALAIPLWPLWAPVALARRPGPGASTQQPGRPAPPEGWGMASPPVRAAHSGAAGGAGAAPSPVAEAAARVQAALHESVEACAGTPLEALLPRDAAARIAAEVTRAVRRHDELCALLRREGFDAAEAERRIASLEREPASPRAIATARLHLENVRRLSALRDRDARALEELADLVQALRAQLLVARYAGAGLTGGEASTAGPNIEGTSGIVSEVWARVEGLSAVLEPQDALDPDPLPRGASPNAAPNGAPNAIEVSPP